MNKNVFDNGSDTRLRRSADPRVAAAFLILLVLVLPGCRTREPSSGNELTVSAAVSLKDAFDEIAELNEKRTGTKIHFNYGASGALQKQIEAGAPADIFASASVKQMDDLAAKRLIVPATRMDFARNALVLVVPAKGQMIASFSDLTNPAVKKVAIGNPRIVPAGQYAEQTLNSLKLLPEIQSKLIFAEDVRQVLDYVVHDEVDAGIVYSSDASGAADKVRMVAQAPEDSHYPIRYPIATVKESRQQEAARKFIDLVLSPEGQSILIKHGFLGVK